jgi:hypothetical protein
MRWKFSDDFHAAITQVWSYFVLVSDSVSLEPLVSLRPTSSQTKEWLPNIFLGKNNHLTHKEMGIFQVMKLLLATYCIQSCAFYRPRTAHIQCIL